MKHFISNNFIISILKKQQKQLLSRNVQMYIFYFIIDKMCKYTKF
jgi:hypothetical protein